MEALQDRAAPVDVSGVTGAITLRIDGSEIASLRQILDESIASDVDLAEDLRALNRCHDEPVRRAALAMRLRALVA